MFKILFIGDIFGEPGRNAVKKILGTLIHEEKVDLVIANSENVTNGRGMSLRDYNFLKECGVNFFTGGNHSFDNQDVYEYIDNKDFIRPANYNKYVPGIGSRIISVNGTKIRITNLLGRAFINDNTNNFYETMEKILEDDKENPDIHFVDFHGEATAEKIAFFEYFKGKVNAIVGTHTHVQTADNKVQGGTAYITDVGATCAFDSIIGASKKEVLFKERVGLPVRFKPGEGRAQFCGVLIYFKTSEYIPEKIERIFIKNI